jgi:hypothetical protein
MNYWGAATVFGFGGAILRDSHIVNSRIERENGHLHHYVCSSIYTVQVQQISKLSIVQDKVKQVEAITQIVSIDK